MRCTIGAQHTFEWFAARNGRLTASRICDVMAKLKSGGEAAARRNYRTEILCERLTGSSADHYVSPAMERGTAEEPFARTAYEIETGLMVDQTGFVLHPIYDFTGASPDGLVETDGGVEFKNPNTATHLEWMVAGVVPEEHKDQLLWNMACCEREWWDFVSRDSRLPPKLQNFIVRLPRDDKRIAQIEAEVVKLHHEVEFLCAQLGVEGQLPPIESFCEKQSAEQRTVRIGAHDVPADLAEMLGGEIAP